MTETSEFKPPKAHSGGREWLFRVILLTLSLVASLSIAEGITRVFFPLYGGVDNVTMEGAPVKEWFAPSSVYRQISNEYDAITTITDKGHRVPGTSGNPDVVFVGDSFTFGFGLKDDDTFASRYCAATHLACANLGIPGSGTVRQLRRLEQFMTEYRWKPKQVKWFFFGMSGSFSAGNDFVDNYDFGRRTAAQATGGASRPAPPPTFAGRLIGLQSLLLNNSYLMRHAKYRWGPLMKSLVVDPPGNERMSEALHYTEEALKELDDTSRRLGFKYVVYLIVPVQDIIRGTANETLATFNSVSPKPAIATAGVMTDEPTKYYFAYDGHLNAEGNRRVADMLIAQDQH